MNSTDTKINSAQILASLLVCRFFTLLVAVPNSRYTLEGGGSLLAPLLSGGAMLLLILPLISLMKKFPGKSLSAMAGEYSPLLRKVILLWELLFCLLSAIGTASQSEYFVSTALYPDAKRQWVLLLFLLVVWYMAAMGLESISRVSLLVCGLILLSFALIFSGVAEQLDWLELTSPLLNSAEKLSMTTLAYWGQNMELVLLGILQPFCVKPDFKKDSLSFLFSGLLVSETVIFFTTAVLGSYGKTRMFPVYTLAALSGHGFFSRLDYLHIINWTFACLLRCGLFSWAAVLLLKELFPKADSKILRAASIGIIAVVCLLLIREESSFQWFYLIFASGIPVLVSLVIFPLILLWKSRRRAKQ